MKTSLRGRRGFSLLEILIVLVLLAFAALLVTPSFTRGLGGLEMKTAARDMITRMKQARTKAISKQVVHRMLLDLDDEQKPYYSLTNDYEEVLEAFPLPKGVTFQTEEELPVKISFYPNGRSSGAVFVMVREEGMRLAVAVDAVTGFGRVLDNDDPENPIGK